MLRTRTADFGTLMSWKSFSLTSTDSWMLPLALETLNKEYKLITHNYTSLLAAYQSGLEIFLVEISPTSMSEQFQCR